MTHIKSLKHLELNIPLSPKERESIESVIETYPIHISNHYLKLIDKHDGNCPIRKQVIPSIEELRTVQEDRDDPLQDEKHSPLPGVIHRYKDRCLLLPTNTCASQCRFCFRKNLLHKRNQVIDLNKCYEYIKQHSELREVILSGGDPLTLHDKEISSIFENLSSIKHILNIRIHTRIPVFEPKQITNTLINIFKKAPSLWIVIHVNHRKEISPEFIQSIQKLKSIGIPLLSQTVLLKDVNNSIKTLKELFYELVQNGIKPYYLHQGDIAKGTVHFRTTQTEGIKLMKALRKEVSGLSLPTYVHETKTGKMPLL